MIFQQKKKLSILSLWLIPIKRDSYLLQTLMTLGSIKASHLISLYGLLFHSVKAKSSKLKCPKSIVPNSYKHLKLTLLVIFINIFTSICLSSISICFLSICLVINLREKNYYYYELGYKLQEYLEDDEKEIEQTIKHTFLKRIKEFSRISYHL